MGQVFSVSREISAPARPKRKQSGSGGCEAVLGHAPTIGRLVRRVLSLRRVNRLPRFRPTRLMDIQIFDSAEAGVHYKG